jgi:signal transduction histidine kinase
MEAAWAASGAPNLQKSAPPEVRGGVTQVWTRKTKGPGNRRMSGAKRTILLVEDSADDRALIRQLLAREGAAFEVIEAATGAEGLQHARTGQVDCVLLDYYLPDMDGRQFLAALEVPDGERTRQPLPVALLTGRESRDIAVEVLNRGAHEYLVKDSISGATLVRAVENAVEKFQIHRELQEQRDAVELHNRRLEALQEELQTRIAELAEAQQARDRFLAIMSHEMRTPLNAILGYADLLELGLDGDLTEGQHAHIERIRVGGRHLLDLINDLLDLARADARRLELDIRPVDLAAVLEEVVALLESQAMTKGIGLELVPCGSRLPLVRADLQRLRQILTNLVGNAIKFTEDGSVTIRCETRVDGTVRVNISDTGIGIDTEALPFIFDEFFQARNELTREKGGSGLGLAISQRLVALMGGEITARSVLGTGSEFTLVLQQAEAGSELRVEDVERLAARMEAHSAPRRGLARAAVSVVAFGDDAGALAELQSKVHPGVNLAWTTRPEDVPRLAAEKKAALVILDASSAEGAAWRAAYALQEQPELSDVAVLLLPAIPAMSGDEATQGLDLGWISLVPKPFTPGQLTRAVSSAVRGPDEVQGEQDDASFDVLVIDDDPDSRRVAAKILAEANMHVREAPDGESALTVMRQNPPDVVVLDLMMPVLDGFGVLATMRADALLASLPVVVLTAKSLTEAERQFLARSAAAVLQKGEHRLADVAALVLRAAARAPRASTARTGD